MAFIACKNQVIGCNSILKCNSLGDCQYIASTSWPTNPQQPIKFIPTANDKQVAGDHYKQYGDLQPWDVIIAWNMPYLTGTALKYLARWRDKGGIDDLKKAIHFIEKQIEVAEKEAAAKLPNQTTQTQP